MSTGRLGAGDTAIQPTIFDAKADILTATAADTPARLAVGNNGETLVADSSATTGLRWQGSMAAGKNAIINGGFDIWQRGTASQTPANGQQMNCDRFYFTGGGGVVFTQDTDVPTDPYFQYSLKTVDGANYGMSFAQKIEAANAVLLAGKTVTVSFYAKMTSGTATMYVNAYYPSAKDNFASLTTIASNTVSTPTSSWARYQTTFSLPSNVQNGLVILIGRGSTSNTTFYTGIQVELGSIATPFTRAGGTLAGELAACQRYYYRIAEFQIAGGTQSAAENKVFFALNSFNGVQMRTTPTAAFESTPYITNGASNLRTVTAVAVASKAMIGFTYDSTRLTDSYSYMINAADAGRAVSLSAEL